MPKSFTFSEAKKSDKKDILKFYKRYGYSAKFMGFDTCYFIEANGEIIASVILSNLVEAEAKAEVKAKAKTEAIQSEPEHNDSSLAHAPLFLHALFVVQDYRKLGLGRQLMAHAIERHHHIICFAEQTLSPFYQALRFQPVECGALPVIFNDRYRLYADQQPSLVSFEYRAR